MVLQTDNSYIHDEHFSPITNHPLIRYVMEVSPMYVMENNDMTRVFNESLKSGDDELLDEMLRNPAHFTDASKFLTRESELCYEMCLRLDKLQHTIFMLSFFPSKPDKNTLPLTRAEYIENILELYIVNSIAYQDRILELTAFLFDIEVKKDDSNRKQYIRLQLAGFPGIITVLDQIDYTLSLVRKSRNTIIHSSSYYDEEIENIFQYELRYRAERESRGLNEKLMLKQLNTMYNICERNKLAEIYSNDAILTNITTHLLDELYKQHKKKIKGLGVDARKYKIEPQRKREKSIRSSLSVFDSLQIQHAGEAS